MHVKIEEKKHQISPELNQKGNTRGFLVKRLGSEWPGWPVLAAGVGAV